MKTNISTISSRIPAIFLSLLILPLLFFVTVNPVLASEVTGTLNTAADSIVIPDPNFPVPLANPNSGTFASAQSVTLTASGALGIRYTLDDSIPSCANTSANTSLAYSAPITISQTTTLKAIACYANDKASTGFLYVIYTITIPETAPTTPPVTPPANPPATNTGTGTGGGPSSSSFSTPASLGTGDANNDGKVNILDFVLLMANWGKTGSGNAADFNADGKVDILDFVKLMAGWSK